MKRWTLVCGTLLFVFGLSACSEKPQTATPRKTDAKAWQGAANPYVASGWKAGDQTSWDEQMRARAQAQNEYGRVK